MKKEYEILRNKHNLPSYKELNIDFEICSISKEEDILKEIVKKILYVIDNYINLLEDIIQPDSRFYNMKEANVLDANSRLIVKKIYHRLVYTNRASIELNLDYTDEKASQFIKNTYEEWQTTKKELRLIFTTLKESWSKETETKPDGGYFG